MFGKALAEHRIQHHIHEHGGHQAVQVQHRFAHFAEDIAHIIDDDGVEHDIHEQDGGKGKEQQRLDGELFLLAHLVLDERPHEPVDQPVHAEIDHIGERVVHLHGAFAVDVEGAQPRRVDDKGEGGVGDVLGGIGDDAAEKEDQEPLVIADLQRRHGDGEQRQKHGAQRDRVDGGADEKDGEQKGDGIHAQGAEHGAQGKAPPFGQRIGGKALGDHQLGDEHQLVPEEGRIECEHVFSLRLFLQAQIAGDGGQKVFAAQVRYGQAHLADGDLFLFHPVYILEVDEEAVVAAAETFGGQLRLHLG